MGRGVKTVKAKARAGRPVAKTARKPESNELQANGPLTQSARKPPKAKVRPERPVGSTARQRKGSKLHELEKRLAEALAQQQAIAEILEVMSVSPGDVHPVLDAVTQRAARLCDAPFARVALVDGDMLRAVSDHSADGTPQPATIPIPLKRTSITGRTVLDRATIHHSDVVSLLDIEYPDARANALRMGFRAMLSVPLMREGNAYGAIFLWRREPGLFSPNQVALVETFARQAAIAIDNARLFNETKERLEQQTATSQILRVISGSPTDVQPVFDTIANAALKLCRARSANLFTYDGELVHLAAMVNLDPAYIEAMRRTYPRPLSRATAVLRAIQMRSVVMIPDVLEDKEYISALGIHSTAGGFRSVLAVPLMSDGHAIGGIAVGRAESGSFPDAQVALLKTFADQAVIAIENVRLFTELEKRNCDLTVALDQQTATSEILRVISQSQTEVQPVFDAIVRSAVRLCGADHSIAARFDGELLHPLAHHGFSSDALKIVEGMFPMRPGPENMLGRAALSKAVVNLPDMLADPTYSRDYAIAGGWRSGIGVPMLREGELIGAIAVSRREPGAFPDHLVALLKTFADQAVIAVENVRLFTELEVRNRDLTESLEQQTATSEILRAISSSPTHLQPVLEAVVSAAARFCGAPDVMILRVEGDVLRGGTGVGQFAEVVRQRAGSIAALEIPINSKYVSGRAVFERRSVHVYDLAAESEDEYPIGRELQRRFGHHTCLATPLLREGVPLGVACLFRMEVSPFSEKQIELLRTFADQAVIAIENVRLFTELEVRNRDLTEALQHQTATSEILRVISSSPTDVQPVFETVCERAEKLCDAEISLVSRVEGEQIHLVAIHGVSREGTEAIKCYFPMRVDAELTSARAIRGRAVVHTTDVLADPEYEAKDAAIAASYRSCLAVPMFREGQVVGAIFVARANPGRFADSKVELLKTFADQAVIAVENVRLFNELESRTAQLTRSVGELKALGEVGQAVSSTLDLETVLRTIVSRATQLSGMDGGSIWEYDDTREEFHLHATDRLPRKLVDVLKATPIRKGEGALGRLAMTVEPVEIRDFVDERSYQSRLREALIRFGYRSVVAVPLLREDRLLGALAVNRKSPGDFEPEVIDLLKTFATQSALAIQNARLFREIEDKSRQLEVASKHKSEFLANMSHELRTPLNAIIGFSEVLAERMFGEVNDKQAEYLNDILESGRHLLSLINDILDLSKIEAGRMELESTDFDLPGAIENTLILVRERAQRRAIALARTVDARLGMVHADERKVKQVLLNLLSNALKFTPEGGQIAVRAGLNDGSIEISVTDTGVGIAPDDQETVFEEFRQVGTASKKVEGTGLGLAISRKFIELHGGKIWVESRLGAGSTFVFSLPRTWLAAAK